MNKPSVLDRLPTVDEIRRELERTNKYKRVLRQLLLLVETAERERRGGK